MTLNRLDASLETLSKLDLSGLVTSMALGIAEAQKQLDDNSIAQTLILANPDLGVNGQSLLELGFTPSFYQFQYVDISANMSLKVSSDFEVEAAVSIAISNSGDRSKIKNKEIIKEGEDSEYRQEYESSNSLVVKSSSQQTFEVGEKSKVVRLDKSKGGYKRKHKMVEDILTAEEVERVHLDIFAANTSVTNAATADVIVAHIDGALTFTLPPKVASQDLAIFKVGEFDNTTAAKVEASATHTFTVQTDHNTTFSEIAKELTDNGTTPGSVQAFYSDKFDDIASPYGVGDITSNQIRIYFEFAKWDIQSITADGNKDNTANLAVIETLALILKNDSSAAIQLTGHTDKVGGDQSNIKLSKDRAKSVAEILKSKGVNSSQIVELGVGEDEAVGNDTPNHADNHNDRYVEVKFVNDDTYYILEDGELDANPANSVVTTPNANGLNDYIYHYKDATGGSYGVDATVSDDEIGSISLSGSITAISTAQIQTLTGYSDLVSAGYEGLEVVNNICYFLNTRTKYKYTALSRTAEKVKIKASGEESESSEDSIVETEEYALGESQNQNSYSRRRAKDLKSKSVWQLDASLDARIASRFSFSIEGNSSMSARMVALPAPEAFLALVAAEATNP